MDPKVSVQPTSEQHTYDVHIETPERTIVVHDVYASNDNVQSKAQMLADYYQEVADNEGHSKGEHHYG